MHPGALHDDAHSGESVTPPMHSPGPRPQLQLYLPEGGCHPSGPYFNTVSATYSDQLPTYPMHNNNTGGSALFPKGHPLSASNPMAYTSYHTQKSLDTSTNVCIRSFGSHFPSLTN